MIHRDWGICASRTTVPAVRSVVLLDEATSALDVRTERALTAAMDELMKGPAVPIFREEDFRSILQDAPAWWWRTGYPPFSDVMPWPSLRHQSEAPPTRMTVAPWAAGWSHPRTGPSSGAAGFTSLFLLQHTRLCQSRTWLWPRSSCKGATSTGDSGREPDPQLPRFDLLEACHSETSLRTTQVPAEA